MADGETIIDKVATLLRLKRLKKNMEERMLFEIDENGDIMPKDTTKEE